MIAIALPASAGKVTAKFSELGLASGAVDSMNTIHINDDIDLKFHGGGNSMPSYNAANGQLTIMMQNTLTFIGRSADVTITEIVLKSTGTSNLFTQGAADCIPTGTFTIDKEALTSTWADPVGANSVMIANKMGAPRVISVTVAYTGGSDSGEESGGESGKDPDPTPGVTEEFDNLFVDNFDTSDEFGNLTVINVNSSSNTWKYYKSSQCAEIDNDMGSVIPKDDYLVTPGLELKAGNTYRVSFAAWAGNANFT
ncbi:MAG: hypothetical protein K2J06_08480 [Muribaculaceae bacterium]|nr:hypothetical protein [Muribaculaceae bacterium]